MEYDKTITLKDGRTCFLRSGTDRDGQAVMENFNATHAETDFLLSYPEENSMTAQQEAEFLARKAESPNEVEILAIVDGRVAGTAGIESLGIGSALLDGCVECARQAGYRQLELTAVADNESALALYRKKGFIEFGRNPKGFRSRISGYQELVYMRLEL